MITVDVDGIQYTVTENGTIHQGNHAKVDYFYIKQRRLEAYYHKLRTARQQEKAAIRRIWQASLSIMDEEEDVMTRVFRSQDEYDR